MRFLKFWQESNQDTRQTIYSNEFQRANRHVFALSYMYFYMFIIMCIQYYYSHKGLNFIVSMLKSTKKVRCVQHGISKINMYVLSIAPVLFGYGLVCRDPESIVGTSVCVECVSVFLHVQAHRFLLQHLINASVLKIRVYLFCV